MKLITFEEALKIEPNINKDIFDSKIIFSPTTQVGSPILIMKEIEKDLRSLTNVTLLLSNGYKELIKQSENEIIIKDNNDNYHKCNYVINTSGLYADKVAKQFSLAKNYDMVPLRGTYLYDSTHSNDTLKTLLYPLPPSSVSKGNNFLGIHTTLSINGGNKIGPTALPCVFREQHFGISRFKIKEFRELLNLYFKIIISNNRDYYIRLLKEQMKNQFNSNVLKEVSMLTTVFNNRNNLEHKKGGVRAQLINLDNFNLENDFVILKGNNHLHFLNMISPGWTCSFAIADDILNIIKEE